MIKIVLKVFRSAFIQENTWVFKNNQNDQI